MMTFNKRNYLMHFLNNIFNHIKYIFFHLKQVKIKYRYFYLNKNLNYNFIYKKVNK